MIIPLQVNLGVDGVIIEGVHKGKEHYYKTCLLNVLMYLKPRISAEIGTWFGGTVKVFERYFEEHRPDGRLVTADIMLRGNLATERVRQVQVYPHSRTYWTRHPVTDADLLPDGCNQIDRSEDLNRAILERELSALDVFAFDFAFIDGDHAKESVVKDIAIAKALTKPPHYILLEDISEGIHEVSAYFRDDISKQWNHYDFQDWPILSGCSLIWKKA
jgi:predicted O-methyltransferase YrrM